MGTGKDPNKASKRWKLEEVLDAMDEGVTFYTKGESTGKIAGVHKYRCKTCGRITLRSDADAIPDNNLDNIRKCRSWE